eukprot:TRINITY_DN2523_c0_g1_i2.p1 TRINITY_DN2523_c0_g1~~TRINITY_DN2523_c0_g1_i2.p1  ORF type:complete len:353 (+),score=57.32 TRINITY_DN2523_c0_g1_i2:67-1059(+)
MKRETDHLVDSILKIGKEGDWNQITALLFSFQAFVNRCTQDYFSIVPKDICRLIFDYLPLEDKFSLSMTNKRFNSLGWMESISKQESLKYFDELVAFPKEFFIFAIERFGISWRSIAWCFLRPNETESSFRRYKSKEYSYVAHRIDSFRSGSREKVDHLIIGNISNDDETVDDISLDGENPGALVIESSQIYSTKYIAFLEDDGTLFAGEIIEFGDTSATMEGYMELPDGYSFSGKCIADDIANFRDMEFIEEPIHPKIQECLEKNMCTRFAGVIGPQMMSETIDGTFCDHCVANCQDQEEGETEWSYASSCGCNCEGIIESKKRKEPPS